MCIHILDILYHILKSMNGLQSYDVDHDPNRNNGSVCEALSEPRRLVELDDSHLVGDDDIRYHY